MDYGKKVIVCLADGSYVALEAWQKMYGLKVGSTQIGKYFKYTESRFIKDIEDYGLLEVNGPLMMVLDKYREYKRKPVNVNSFNRSEQKQQELRDRGFKAATFSPHVVKKAGDVDTISEKDTYASVKIFEKVSKELHIPIRLGYKQYLANGQTFIHVDVCPLYYRIGGVHHSEQHPAVWETEARW